MITMQGYNEQLAGVQAVRHEQRDRLAFWRSHGPELPQSQGAQSNDILHSSVSREIHSGDRESLTRDHASTTADSGRITRGPVHSSPERPSRRASADSLGAETMSDHISSDHVYSMPEVYELPMFDLGSPLDFLSAAQRRDFRAIQADHLYTGADDFCDGLTVDYGRVI